MPKVIKITPKKACSELRDSDKTIGTDKRSELQEVNKQTEYRQYLQF